MADNQERVGSGNASYEKGAAAGETVKEKTKKPQLKDSKGRFAKTSAFDRDKLRQSQIKCCQEEDKRPNKEYNQSNHLSGRRRRSKSWSDATDLSESETVKNSSKIEIRREEDDANTAND